MGFCERGNEMTESLVQGIRSIISVLSRSPATSGKTEPGGGPC